MVGVPSAGVNDIDALALPLAQWFEARLHQTSLPLMSMPTSTVRLYGLEVIDAEALSRLADDAARAVFLAQAPDLTTLRADPGSMRLLDFDASALVSHPWMSTASASTRPGAHAARRRALVVQVTTRSAGATVTRFDDDPAVVVCSPAA